MPKIASSSANPDDRVYDEMAEIISRAYAREFGVSRKSLAKLRQEMRTHDERKASLQTDLFLLERLRGKLSAVFDKHPERDTLIKQWGYLLRSKLRVMKYWSLMVGSVLQTTQWLPALAAAMLLVKQQPASQLLAFLCVLALFFSLWLVWLRTRFEERAEWFDLLALQLDAIEKLPPLGLRAAQDARTLASCGAQRPS